MARSMDTLRTPFEASPFGLSIRRDRKWSEVSCLDYSGGPGSLSHCIGQADGTRPQPMQSEIKNYLVLSYFSGRDWSTEVVQSGKQIPLSQKSRLCGPQ